MKKNACGFSLIELLLVIIIMGFVLVAVVSFSSRLRGSNEARTLAGEMSDRQSVFTNQVKRDFEAVGYNLRAENRNGESGQVEPLFYGSSDYRIEVSENSANILRNSYSDEPELLSAWGLMRGSGEMSFIPRTPDSSFGYRNAAGETFAFYYSNAQEWLILFSGERVFSSAETDETLATGDRLTIAFDNSSETACAVSFYYQRGEERRFIFRRQTNCRYSLQAFLSTAERGEVNDFTLRGAWLVRLDQAATNYQLPVLPTKNGKFSELPVWIENEGQDFTLLRSDLASDPATTLTETRFDNDGSTVELTVSNSLRGTFAEGDYCLLIDDAAHKSVLGKIGSSYPGNNGLIFRFTPALDSAPAWDEFYSERSDYIEHRFPVYSRVVRFNAPVSYRFAPDRTVQATKMLRREGNAPWENILFGITESRLTQVISDGKSDFILNFSILPENMTSVEPRPVSINFSPTGLNSR